MKKILIWGSSEHAKYTIDIVEEEGVYSIGCVFDPLKESFELLGYPVFGIGYDFADVIRENGIEGGIVAIGDNWIRHQQIDLARRLVPDFELVSAIHPSAAISPYAVVEAGTVIMRGAVVENHATVGEGCFLATNSSLNHDSVMMRFSSLAAHACVGGGCSVGEFSAVLLGANVISRVEIGSQSVIGAGGVVVRNIPDNVMAYGVPARVMRPRSEGDRYL